MNCCCINCFDDSGITNYINDNGVVNNCSFCGSKNVKVLTTKELGYHIRACFSIAYENVEEVSMLLDRDTGEYTEGSEASEILIEELTPSDELARLNDPEYVINEILGESGPSFHEIKDGSYDSISDGELFVLRDKYCALDTNRFTLSWNAFKEYVKHYSRFFDFEGEITREDLLSDLYGFFPKFENILPKGSEIWRARIADDDFQNDPTKIQDSLGPPPCTSSKNNRMSPLGIPYFYASDNSDTCLSEIRPVAGSTVWIGKFILKEDIKLIDLSIVPKIDIPSMFDPSYDHDLIWVKFFLTDFAAEISSPISADNEYLEYVPMQVLSEFIRTKGYDGLKFSSSQHLSGFNYTLFYQPDEQLLRNHTLDFDNLKSFSEYFYLEEFKQVRVDGIEIIVSSESEKQFTQEDFVVEKPETEF